MSNIDEKVDVKLDTSKMELSDQQLEQANGGAVGLDDFQEWLGKKAGRYIWHLFHK